MPTNQYVEVRGGYYVAGTRIGPAKLYGAITFILEHPTDIDSYLKEQDARWDEFKARNPLSPGMAERFERARRELPVRQP
jgi:hypothetical protein